MAAPSRLPRVLGRLALVAGGLVAGLLLAEVALRLRSGAVGAEFLLAETASLTEDGLFRGDPETLVSLRPGAVARMRTPEYDQVVRVNDLGLRGPAVPPKAPDELRVLLVGDSFTLASQVALDETFGGRLEAGLTEALGRPVTTWNAGCDAIGTFQQTRLARRLAPAIDADVVLWTVFTGNDFSDNRAFPEAVRRGAPATPPRAQPGPLDRLASWSMLAQYARILGRSMDTTWPGRARHHRELAIFTDPAALATQGEPTAAALAELSTTCAELGVRCAVAVAGPAFVVHPERAEATFWYFGHDPAAADVDAPTRFVLEHLPEEVPGLDLSPALRAAAGGEALYFTLDGHWTAAGHRVVGEAMVPWLADVLSRPAAPASPASRTGPGTGTAP